MLIFQLHVTRLSMSYLWEGPKKSAPYLRLLYLSIIFCKASGCEATHNSCMSMTHSYDFPPKPQERPARREKSPCTARPSEMPVCSQTQKETHVDLEMMDRAKQYLKASVQPVQEKGRNRSRIRIWVLPWGFTVILIPILPPCYHKSYLKEKEGRHKFGFSATQNY